MGTSPCPLYGTTLASQGLTPSASARRRDTEKSKLRGVRTRNGITGGLQLVQLI
jgi:hypothetical protein